MEQAAEYITFQATQIEELQQAAGATHKTTAPSASSGAESSAELEGKLAQAAEFIAYQAMQIDEAEARVAELQARIAENGADSGGEWLVGVEELMS